MHREPLSVVSDRDAPGEREYETQSFRPEEAQVEDPIASNEIPKHKRADRKTRRLIKLKLRAIYPNKCMWCGVELTMKFGRRNTSTVDHIMPISKGGSNSIGNQVLACHNCNSARGDMTITEFALWAERLAQRLSRFIAPSIPRSSNAETQNDSSSSDRPRDNGV